MDKFKNNNGYGDILTRFCWFTSFKMLIFMGLNQNWKTRIL